MPGQTKNAPFGTQKPIGKISGNESSDRQSMATDVGNELSAATRRKEMTLDLLFHKIKAHQWMMGSLIFVTSYFLQICFWGSLLSTLDSLLFCIFIIQPVRRKCKMGCSIKERRKVWRKSGFTDVFGCGMITMLGGFCGGRSFSHEMADLSGKFYGKKWLHEKTGHSPSGGDASDRLWAS